MQVILRKEVEKLGAEGELVKVKDGYARNFLIPRGLAVRATEGRVRAIETEKKQKAFKIERERKAARDVAESLERLTLVVTAKAGDEGRLFGTVTTQMISDALKAKGYDIDRRSIEIESPIKQVGLHTVKVKLYTDVVANLNMQVDAE